LGITSAIHGSAIPQLGSFLQVEDDEQNRPALDPSSLPYPSQNVQPDVPVQVAQSLISLQLLAGQFVTSVCGTPPVVVQDLTQADFPNSVLEHQEHPPPLQSEHVL
jgi:hypothetical protein